MEHMESVRASKRQRHQLKRQLAAAAKDKEHATAEIPMAKSLASSEKRERDRALAALTAFLSSGSTIPSEDMLRLWKGLYQSFYHSDKPLVQQVLADELAHLVLIIAGVTKDSSAKQKGKEQEQETTGKKRKALAASDEVDGPSIEKALAALSFFEGFWDTMVRDWQGLDKHRIPKFFLLMRRFWAAGIRLLEAFQWESTLVTKWEAILTKENAKPAGGPLSPTDLRVPRSISMHLADISMIELDRLVDGLSSDDAKVDLFAYLTPFITVLRYSQIKPLFQRIMERLIVPLLDGSEQLAKAATTAAEAQATLDNGKSDESAQAETQAAQAEASLAAASSHVPLLLAATVDGYLTERGEAQPSGPGEVAAQMAAADRDGKFLSNPETGKSLVAFREKLQKTLFDAAAKIETRGANRNKLYKLVHHDPKTAKPVDDDDW